jgi:hypothetical protein
MKLIKLFVLLSFLFILFVFTASAQTDQETQTREITSDDFVKKRPARKSSKQKKSNRKKYKYTRKAKKYRRRNSRRKTQRKTQKPTVPKTAQVGVTMWKLRPPRTGETGPFLPVQTPDGFSSMWTPERVSTDTLFKAGDRIRLAVESTIAGYLYIINSEIYTDETVGNPYLIFPESQSIKNKIRPGMLVDIPDQSEDNPYFLIAPKREDYRGELLFVVITPQPLKTLVTDETGRITSLEFLEELEETANAEIFERVDGIGEIFTKSESEATCGSKKRQLVREKKSDDNPCGTQSRQLTRESPPPQTIFKTNFSAGQALAFPIVMNVTGTEK